jgi:broad specificity phosphatase PhoE
VTTIVQRRTGDSEQPSVADTIAAMGVLYLVRHGQASFGAADYDQLSDTGRSQCAQLGAWFAAHGITFETVLTGTLRRHAQSLEAIEAGLQRRHDVLQWPGLNEYDPQALLLAAHGRLPDAPDSPEAVKQHFRLLREGLLDWMHGRTQPQGMAAYAQFHAGVVGALEHVRERHAEGNALIVSSGGPIAMAVGHVLGLQPEAVVELNLQLRNSALCELRVSPKRLTLVSFNTLPHLGGPEHRAWLTHA